MPEKHALADIDRLPVAMLDGEPLVLLSDAFCTRRLFDESLAAACVEPDVTVEMNAIEGILATVRATNTATVLPALTLQMGVARAYEA